MKKFILILAMLLSGSVYSQDSLSVKSFATVLGIGEALQFEGKALKFIEIISDSRCPTGVTCVWEGEAKMLFEIYEDGKFRGEKVLTTSGGAGLSSLVDLLPKADLFISALNLKPYPNIDRKIAPSEYMVNVEVQEIKEE